MGDAAAWLDSASGQLFLSLITAAKVNGLTVLTLNPRHFGPLGVATVDRTRELPTVPGG